MYVFFFSSRRRHTRWPRDWSSDVCSSDLTTPSPPSQFQRIHVPRQTRSNQRSPSSPTTPPRHPPPNPTPNPPTTNLERSEERRVGKESRRKGGAKQEQQKEDNQRRRQHAS